MPAPHHRNLSFPCRSRLLLEQWMTAFPFLCIKYAQVLIPLLFSIIDMPISRSVASPLLMIRSAVWCVQQLCLKLHSAFTVWYFMTRRRVGCRTVSPRVLRLHYEVLDLLMCADVLELQVYPLHADIRLLFCRLLDKPPGRRELGPTCSGRWC